MKCKICNSDTTPIFKAKIINKYDVQYYECPRCLFIQTEKEYWLKEAYQSSMNISDTGVLTRNILLGLKTSLIIQFLFNRKGKFLDYAGGWGIFTRLMRDIGFDFYWFDPYTSNELARGFEADLSERYEALTIFEGFEHFQNPYEDLEKMFKLSDTIIFSTTLVPKPTPQPKDWWYYGLEHGQHVALYSKESFEFIAKKYNCNYYTDGKYMHMFTRRKISKLLFFFLTSFFGFLLIPLVLVTNKSKTITDSKSF
ncbi:hypothetical protein CVU76_01215 [Candidatus Dojkabacteria bacterium HGW-Dojkabacteria-1]|uniref:Class I SAM-dependent methyltransferase n=1 Tax=Candidatus Dojkabacteria bacterium HGW-Dojkabacteria-1 TaxID=2013761 RepID=A0A2N2F354_9BACT|nr:MAG: hypothetical protein CVU76_01215 [Candidatus Dojkabacteria bacterium HGW-Dojkabacteria-1]